MVNHLWNLLIAIRMIPNQTKNKISKFNIHYLDLI